MKKQIIFYLLCCLSLAWGDVIVGNRIALVIGNSHYKNLNSLRNPQADATGIVAELKKFGFTLIRPIRAKQDVQNDLNQAELLTAKNALKKASQGAEIVFLYYSGHGASLGAARTAHILPVDVNRPTADISSLELLAKRSVSLDDLLQGLDKKAQLTVAVFDACREIPALEANKGVFEQILGDAASWRGLKRLNHGRKRIIAYAGGQGKGNWSQMVMVNTALTPVNCWRCYKQSPVMKWVIYFGQWQPKLKAIQDNSLKC